MANQFDQKIRGKLEVTGDLLVSGRLTLANNNVDGGSVRITNVAAASTAGDALTYGSLSGLTHNILSATHLDSTAASLARGDILVGQGASPKLTRLAIGTANKALVSDGTDVNWLALDHTVHLANIGTNTHAQLDTFALIQAQRSWLL